jgi:hypothetical protein
LKYNQQLLKQTLAEVEEIKLMLRTIFAGLKDSFNFERSLIERVACADAVDKEILHLLYQAGSPGLLPKDLTAKLVAFKVTRHQVSRRILRMNRQLEAEFGELVAEKRGWHWALTSFVYGSWENVTKKLKKARWAIDRETRKRISNMVKGVKILHILGFSSGRK